MKAKKPNPKRTERIAKMIRLSGKKQQTVYDAFDGGKVAFWRKRKDNSFTPADEKNIDVLINGSAELKHEIRQKAETKKALRKMINSL